VRVPQLASHVLSGVTRRLSRDWQVKYGHPLELVETFVERERFAGTCYQAAGWVRVGATTGRGRNGGPAASGPVKEVYVLPLRPDFRQRLGA
jgi:branched-subunit amino acid aminotransferase/4-amino-4-deoxychorismate lyase